MREFTYIFQLNCTQIVYMDG